MPGSPRTTRAPLSPSRADARSASTVWHSRVRPINVIDDGSYGTCHVLTKGLRGFDRTPVCIIVCQREAQVTPKEALSSVRKSRVALLGIHCGDDGHGSNRVHPEEQFAIGQEQSDAS